ncbi:hypothetical protein HBI24_063080 [Parastagonospora nodorum]|nr:hypothetical protein HBH47_022600 [Parastagonospora nodorum]KAH4165231.1 hypothetical protein HBH43_141960 [Parastagonospora nodorum]KAH4415234.1 hypothetical protein HBH92_075230 [Parastagonospora nodorum]KAH4440466.1 hypothetical protein HBH93_086090 [Parastagonospora nodorum]KAH4451609.1 hypothetical protein HBH91_114330 [Parastagonospora nodorum]
MSGAAPQGPYGPNNPPPPPMGPPPGKSGHARGRGDRGEPPHPQDSQTSSGPGRAFLNRKLNSRQRRKFFEAQEKSGEGRGRGRSRSPIPRRDQESQASYRERSPIRSESDRGQFVSRSPPGSGRRKSRLRDARQYTPDQIVDETYGRLSPPGNQSRYTSDQTDRQRTNRIWPHEEQNFSGRHSDTYEPAGTMPQPQASAPAWSGDVNKFGTALASGQYKAAYRIEDEVDWDDDEAFDVPGPDPALKASNAHGYEAQQTTYGSASRNHNARGPEPPAAFGREQHDPRNARWEENHGWSQPKQNWPMNNEEQIPRAVFKQRKKGKQGMGAPQRQYIPDHNAVQDNISQRSFAEGIAIHSTVPVSVAIHVPETAFDLRKYEADITKLHKSLPKNRAYRFFNGKTAPYQYGSTSVHDLGLCYVTFCTDGWCEMGAKCAWRHHPLTKAEREWIALKGTEKSRAFLEALPRHWASPEVPLPGANMEEKRFQ